jgi:quercetin dioxygenase-like cupin family protein
MNNAEYTDRVNVGDWPEEVLVPLDSPFQDMRGDIQNLVLRSMGSTAVITSKAGSIRANHRHKTDWHYSYVLSGSIKYYYRPADNKEEPKFVWVKAGQMFFTPPMVDHTMVFPEDTVFITMAKNSRTHENHEADLIRVKMIEKS